VGSNGLKFVMNVYDVTRTIWIESSFVNIPELLFVIYVFYSVLCVTLPVAGTSGENELHALASYLLLLACTMIILYQDVWCFHCLLILSVWHSSYVRLAKQEHIYVGLHINAYFITLLLATVKSQTPCCVTSVCLYR
jgi:hypothetical protein